MLSLTASIIRITHEQSWKSGDTIIPIIFIFRDFFRRSRADNSVVRGPVGPKFELVDTMDVLITCKFKRDWINNNREQVETLF